MQFLLMFIEHDKPKFSGGPSALADFSLSCAGTPHGQRWPRFRFGFQTRFKTNRGPHNLQRTQNQPGAFFGFRARKNSRNPRLIKKHRARGEPSSPHQRFFSVFRFDRIAGNRDIYVPKGPRERRPTNPKNRPPPHP